ncbi:MAG: hypothetical protein J2P49_01920 [Methylocapsa sp.]|nr:hypothetical protein [Methylocapsa sp.]
MKMIDRRAMLRTLLGVVAVATSGFVLAPGQADSAPLEVPTPEGVRPARPLEKSVFVSGRRRPRSRRRTHCKHVHGKEVCKTY